jgi:hypothetical protein
VAHFAAIVTVVTSAGTEEFPPPPLAVQANRWVQPYLRLAHVTDTYRFFARNPAPTDLLWFRLRFQSGRVRWVEWPDADARWLGLNQRRDLATALALRAHLMAPPPGGRWPVLNPAGEACVSSFARYLARTEARSASDPVTIVLSYLVAHRILMPYEIQMGWAHTDLRLYQPIVPLGTHDGDGRRVTASPDASQNVAVSPSAFARWVIEEDVHTGIAGGEGQRAIPHPVRDLLARFPAFAKPGLSGEALQKEIERIIVAGDAIDRIRDPARRAYETKLRARPDAHGPAADRGVR